MPDHGAWDVISGADSGQVVLSVDFPARRRQEAGFPDLATRIGPGYRFMQTKPPAVRSCQRPCGTAYVGPWVDGIARDHRVLAVLGYRIGSVYAAAIAEGISRWQPMPKVILFDPQFASNEHLGLEFHREIGAISSLLSDDEIERITKTATRISESATRDVTDAAAEVAGIYWEVSSIAFERVGLGDTYNEKLIAPFSSYISWLSVAGQIDPGPVWKSSTAIVSSDYADLPGRASQADDASGMIGRSIPFDVVNADLLRSDSVAQAVLGLLASC
jgi:hypothetical protein